MDRRTLLRSAGLAAAALGVAGRSGAADPPAGKGKRLLMFTRSQGFEHPVVKRPARGKLSLAEQITTDLGSRHGIEVVCEKDGRVFLSDEFPRFDGFFFETQGDLSAEKSLDGEPPVTAAGKKALLDAVAAGKGFAGCHCASDTYHSKGGGFQTQPHDQLDPYIAMLGGEFIRHGHQQRAWLRVADKTFPGLKGSGDIGLLEEWYSLKNFAPDLHVVLVQETAGMKDFDYERPDFPSTWARMHGKGRVFYTSLGHREDVWESAVFQQILTGALSWTLGLVDADVKPNITKVAPKANDLPVQK